MTNSFQYAPWVVRTTPTFLYRALKKSKTSGGGNREKKRSFVLGSRDGCRCLGTVYTMVTSFQYATHFLSLSLNLWETRQHRDPISCRALSSLCHTPCPESSSTCKFKHADLLTRLAGKSLFYYETIKRKLNRRLIYECRCDERLKECRCDERLILLYRCPQHY
jgi:hypothetical protein